MSLETDTNLLAAIPIFRLLEHEAIRLLAFDADTVDLEAGEVLFEFGQIAKGGILILDGEISLSQQDGDTNVFDVIGPGTFIGHLALITEVVHRATATCATASRILRIDRASFKKVLREYPGCAAKVRAAIAGDLLSFVKSIEKTRA